MIPKLAPLRKKNTPGTISPQALPPWEIIIKGLYDIKTGIRSILGFTPRKIREILIEPTIFLLYKSG
jgi:hypothetical protein